MLRFKHKKLLGAQLGVTGETFQCFAFFVSKKYALIFSKKNDIIYI